jgi:hypothetical protein
MENSKEEGDEKTGASHRRFGKAMEGIMTRKRQGQSVMIAKAGFFTYYSVQYSLDCIATALGGPLNVALLLRSCCCYGYTE